MSIQVIGEGVKQIDRPDRLDHMIWIYYKYHRMKQDRNYDSQKNNYTHPQRPGT